MKLLLVDGVPQEHGPKYFALKSRHDFTVVGEVTIQPVLEDNVNGIAKTLTNEEALLEKSGLNKLIFTANGNATVVLNSI